MSDKEKLKQAMDVIYSAAFHSKVCAYNQTGNCTCEPEFYSSEANKKLKALLNTIKSETKP